MICKSSLCFAKIWKIDYSKIAKISFVKFQMFNLKIVYLAQLSMDFNNLDFKIRKNFVCKISNVQFKNSVSSSVVNGFQQS